MRTTLPLINTANALSADHPALPGNAIQDTSGFSQILSQEISQQNTPPAMAVTASSSPAVPANAAPSANSQQPAVMDQTSANQVNTQNNNQANNQTNHQTGANAQNNGTTPANTTNNTSGASSAAASSTTGSTTNTADSKKKSAQSASQTTDQTASQATSALTTEMLAQAAGLAGQPAPSSTPSSVMNATSTTSATRPTDTTSQLSNTHTGATSHTTAPVSTSAGLSLPADTAATFQLTGATSASATSAGTAPAKTALPNTVDLSTGNTSLPTPSGTDVKAALLATNIVPPASNNAAPAGASLAIGAPSDAAIINTLPGTVLSEAATSTTGADASNQLSAQVGTPDWNQALSQRVVWMVHGGEQSATLSLNPPDLGPLQVVLNVSNSQANATFITAQPEVKQALEAAMPRLEAMLAGAGIQLGQANVQSGNSGQRQPSQSSPGQSGLSQINNLRSSNEQLNNPLLPLNTEKLYSGQGLVNTFV